MLARVLILLLIFTVGCTAEKDTGVTYVSEIVVDEGDFVKIDITSRIKDSGEVLYEHRSMNFTLGGGAIFPALERAMTGMEVGEERNITLAPEEGYGERAPEKVQTMRRTTISPKFIELSLSDFNTAFDKEPETNETIPIKHWSVRVVSVSNSTVTILHEPENNTEINTDYGIAIVTLNETHVTTTLTPELGALIISDLGEGVISDINESSIMVDFNHPLAGKTLVFEVAVREITKPV